MKYYPTDKIRNIAVVGHGSEGKTTLTEAMLFASGAIDRQGRVEDGNTVSDYDPEEIRRKISISAALVPVEWNGTKINLIDIPGYFDFVGEMVGPMKVADGVLIVVSAASGFSVGAEKAWKMAEAYRKPRIIVINQMDREHTDYAKVVEELREKLGTSVVPVQWPLMKNGVYSGVINVIRDKAYEGSGKQRKQVDIPAEVADAIETARVEVMEASAATDDELMEKYFEEGTLSQEELVRGIHLGVTAGIVVPVFSASALTGVGVQSLLDILIDLMPDYAGKAPVEGTNPRTGQKETRERSETAPFSARVFKTIADPFVGKLSLVKVLSGTLKSDMALYNASKDKAEKIGTLCFLRGKKQVTTDRIGTGDIGALSKLQVTGTGDTLCDAAAPIVYEQMEYPKPCISMAVFAKKSGEEDKVFSGLNRLREEDPTVRISKNVETNENIISGLGELHIKTIAKKLQAKFGVEVTLQDPRIPYRETIRKSVKAEGRHKKQSGGHGQFGHVWVEFEPIYGSEAFEFVDKVVGGVVPRQFIPAVEKGLRENMDRGVLAGYPMVGVRATLYDGSYHAVDSSEMAFKTAARLSFKKGCMEASPVLLEPIYRITVHVPEANMGDILGDLNQRRGRVMGMNQSDEGQEVVAEAPLSELFKYATDLRSMTQARGSFDMEFVRYEEVPPMMATKIIESAKKEVEEEE